MKFTDLVASKNTVEMHLITGNKDETCPVFFFIAMKPEKVKALRTDLVRKDCTLTQYGIILCSGFGYPSDALIAQIKQQFENLKE